MARSQSNNPESKVREIRRQTRRKYSAEEKIRIVLEGLKGEESIDVAPAALSAAFTASLAPPASLLVLKENPPATYCSTFEIPKIGR